MSKTKFISLLLQTLILFLLGFIIVFSNSTILHSLKSPLIILSLLSTIISLFIFFGNKEYENQKFLNLIIGAVSLWLCIFILNYYEIFMNILPTITSIYSLLIGVNFLIEFYLENNQNKLYLIGLFCSLVFAIMLIFKPLDLATFYIKLSGFYFISLSLYILIINVLNYNAEHNHN